MKLFIAEKPSMAKSIAEVMGIQSRKDGYISCRNGDAVTWCFGHLLEQLAPGDYSEKWKKWNINQLPMIPEIWEIRPKKDSGKGKKGGIKKQLDTIKSLLKECDSVVNAGDADREGQLLVDEVLEYFGNKKPTERIWLSALNPESIKKALGQLKNNDGFQNLKDSALARTRADWLVGMNLTRAVSIAADSGTVLSIGRVQTPTLGLVVNRDLEIENFIPKDYFLLQGNMDHQNGAFSTTWSPTKDQDILLDEEGRLVDENIAKKIKQSVSGNNGKVVEYSVKKKKRTPQLPYSLSALQKECSNKFSISAANTLKIAQSLYEKGYTSYPRSDCRYLPEEQFSEASKILKGLEASGFNEAKGANPKIKKACWNTKKITAHHGIIPTGEKVKNLTKDEEKIFNLICKNYLSQFYPDELYNAQSVVVKVNDELWSATGKEVLDKGWTVLFSEGQSEGLPNMAVGDPILCKEVLILSKKTTPPARFTDGSLIDAMSHVHKFVTDPNIKKKLKETQGIGTEATRANIVETLFARKYLKREGKKIISEPNARELIAKIPDQLADPGVTAMWESALENVANGKLSCDKFLEQQKKTLHKMVELACKIEFNDSSPHFECPECGNRLRRRQSKKNKKVFFWVCPSGECPLLSDDNGKPGKSFDALNKEKDKLPKAPCPEEGCDKMMTLRTSKKNSSFHFWTCENKDHPMRFDNDGKPGDVMDFSKKKTGKKRMR